MIDQIPPLAALAAAFAELSGAKVKDVAKYMPPNDDNAKTKAQHKRAALGMPMMAKSIGSTCKATPEFFAIELKWDGNYQIT